MNLLHAENVQVAFAAHVSMGLILLLDGYTRVALNSHDVTFQRNSYRSSGYSSKDDCANFYEGLEKAYEEEQKKKKSKDAYAPNRPLPHTSDGMHIPDTDAPHTQLGTKEGRKGKYHQAREFDEHGNPVRDIDFTDHGRPQNHPNPH